MKLIFSILAFCAGTSALAQEQASVRDRVARFLAANVMGRAQQVETQGTISSDGQDYQVDFKATIRWSGLETTPEGLIFVERREVKQTNTRIDQQGKPIGEPVHSDRTVTHRYAVSERSTTRSLVGLTTVIENSAEDATGSGSITMIEISDDGKELYIYESMAGFVERSLDGVRVEPVSMATAATMYLDAQGKLNTDQTVKFFKVDVNRDFARQEINRFNLSAVELNR
jgi:hypothetical protein